MKTPKISLGALKNERFILPNSNLRSRKGYNELFKKAGFEPKILCETETFDIANSIVASGGGACFTIPQMVKSDKASLIKLFELADAPDAKTLVLAYKKGKQLNRVEKEFYKFCFEDKR
ncbi:MULTISPECIES: LysR family transcriptional regulator substrate-binding protein [unclassified Campylobacter]|uniref:LysR family transcriptional regulator substrate-binding protein n=1 Tax=unclassified Campylobacter TaxID=2593542 RepID=UPI0022E99CBB|nr:MULTISPECIES: LysR family transcriptional regulator substrate-binding protein [unclassified Campylobacter]MDA3042944.1 LysR family transcriptional regulator substrate-binding protein [Campylobacter sp. JMF_09 ED2]MDA3044221.1 LysR family transcriptional regulator substrate-binding protein [Campylobacter sp. JMF_07 ED4]MDA3063570.1 LysR family transcriptional regulator substrate-binding protein [Campylobacter sp. JMF_11 EL3]MDA3071196.1 LysR family transcriptional regulator substrate-binding 